MFILISVLVTLKLTALVVGLPMGDIDFTPVEGGNAPGVLLDLVRNILAAIFLIAAAYALGMGLFGFIRALNDKEKEGLGASLALVALGIALLVPFAFLGGIAGAATDLVSYGMIVSTPV